MAKTIFVAHPISGDVKENLKKVAEICSQIHSISRIPIFPSHTWRQYLDSDNIVTKELAEITNREYFSRRMVDEVWFFGDRMSEGMKHEALLAGQFGIPCYGMTCATNAALVQMKLRPEGSYPGPPLPTLPRNAY